ncbi:hypothetical protein BH09DEP1_BH09DEP1_6090 [soil metagenome]
MKYLLFLIFLPVYSAAFFLDCLNPFYQKRVEKENHRGVIARINACGQIYEVPLSALNIPASWPRISKKVGYFDIGIREWTLFVSSDPHNCVAIMPLECTATTVWGKKVMDYGWTIKPLAQGTAELTVQYLEKDSGQIEEEQKIRITVS